MNARAALVATLAAAAAGVALWLWSPWTPDEQGLGGAVEAQDAEEAGGAPMTAPGARASRREEAMRADAAPTKAVPAAPRDGPGTSSALFERTYEEAERWIAARRAAKADDDELAEASARAEWEVARKRLLGALKRDLEQAKRFLAWLGRQEDAETALYIGRVLPFVWADGFEGHLLRTLQSAAPVLERRLALVGLRGRGLAAAKAITRVADEAEDTTLRAHATEEIASHVGDPHAAPSRGAMHETATKNLADPEAAVRRAALVVLISDRRPLTEEQLAAVRARLEDPDRKIRQLASALLKRQ